MNELRSMPTQANGSTTGNEELLNEQLWNPTRVLDTSEIERCFYKPLLMCFITAKVA